MAVNISDSVLLIFRCGTLASIRKNILLITLLYFSNINNSFIVVVRRYFQYLQEKSGSFLIVDTIFRHLQVY